MRQAVLFSGAVSRGLEHIPRGAVKGSVSSPFAHSVPKKTQHSTRVMGNKPAAYSHAISKLQSFKSQHQWNRFGQIFYPQVCFWKVGGRSKPTVDRAISAPITSSKPGGGIHYFCLWYAKRQRHSSCHKLEAPQPAFNLRAFQNSEKNIRSC